MDGEIVGLLGFELIVPTNIFAVLQSPQSLLLVQLDATSSLLLIGTQMLVQLGLRIPLEQTKAEVGGHEAEMQEQHSALQRTAKPMLGSATASAPAGLSAAVNDGSGAAGMPVQRGMADGGRRIAVRFSTMNRSIK